MIHCDMPLMRSVKPIAAAMAPDCHQCIEPERNRYRPHGEDNKAVVEIDQRLELGDQSHLWMYGVEKKYPYCLEHKLFHGPHGQNSFDGTDIGIAVDNAARHGGSRIGLLFRNSPQARHEIGDDPSVDDEPHKQR